MTSIEEATSAIEPSGVDLSSRLRNAHDEDLLCIVGARPPQLHEDRANPAHLRKCSA